MSELHGLCLKHVHFGTSILFRQLCFSKVELGGFRMLVRWSIGIWPCLPKRRKKAVNIKSNIQVSHVKVERIVTFNLIRTQVVKIESDSSLILNLKVNVSSLLMVLGDCSCRSLLLLTEKLLRQRSDELSVHAHGYLYICMHICFKNICTHVHMPMLCEIRFYISMCNVYIYIYIYIFMSLSNLSTALKPWLVETLMWTYHWHGCAFASISWFQQINFLISANETFVVLLAWWLILITPVCSYSSWFQLLFLIACILQPTCAHDRQLLMIADHWSADHRSVTARLDCLAINHNLLPCY